MKWWSDYLDEVQKRQQSERVTKPLFFDQCKYGANTINTKKTTISLQDKTNSLMKFPPTQQANHKKMAKKKAKTEVLA